MKVIKEIRELKIKCCAECPYYFAIIGSGSFDGTCRKELVFGAQGYKEVADENSVPDWCGLSEATKDSTSFGINSLAQALVEIKTKAEQYDARRRAAITECTRQRDSKFIWERIARKLAGSLREKIIRAHSKRALEFPTGIPSVDEIIDKVRERLEE